MQGGVVGCWGGVVVGGVVEIRWAQLAGARRGMRPGSIEADERDAVR